MNLLSVVKRIDADRRTLAEHGYTVRESTDIGEIDDLMRQTGRVTGSEMLSPARNDFTSANGLFLFLERKGKVVGGCKAKVCDLEDETFEHHQRRMTMNWYGRDEDPLEWVAKPLNRLITGKHIYAGELELARKHRGKTAVVGAFVRILVGLSVVKWPDFTCVYCILPETHEKFARYYGFSNTIRKAYQWKEPIPPGRKQDFLVAVSSRDQLLHDLEHGFWGSAPSAPR